MRDIKRRQCYATYEYNYVDEQIRSTKRFANCGRNIRDTRMNRSTYRHYTRTRVTHFTRYVSLFFSVSPLVDNYCNHVVAVPTICTHFQWLGSCSGFLIIYSLILFFLVGRCDVPARDIRCPGAASILNAIRSEKK